MQIMLSRILYFVKNMAASRHLVLALGFMLITNEPLEACT
jgi:hypothetical protein